MATPFIIGPNERAALADLRDRAAIHPVDMPTLMKAIKTPAGKAAHMAQMNEQTVEIPINFLVTFSIENGHPSGTCRHMSMSSGAIGRAPTPGAAWMVAEELGFIGSLDYCHVYIEDLQRGDGRRHAINIVQPLSFSVAAAPTQ
jgi:hypothetical protein